METHEKTASSIHTLFYLPTFEECLEITKKNDAFLHKIEEYEGHTFHIFNYRLANYGDFAKHKGSIEMRGLTFRGPLKEGIYQRFIHLHKFFNWGEQGATEGVDPKINQIIAAPEKIDGSMIVPILIDGKFVCKTKGTFFSEQAETATKIIDENQLLYDLITNCYLRRSIPIFEFCSPWNQIVIPYKKDELVLLQVRNMETGEYEHDLQKYAEYGIKIPEMGDITTLESYLNQAETLVDTEGWVLQFDNGHFAKVKTEWYRALHHVLTEGLTRENEMIYWVLNEMLDDVLGNVPPDDPRRDYAFALAEFLRGKINEWIIEVQQVIWELDPKRPNSRKTFAIANKEHHLFGVMMQCFTDHENGIHDDEKIFEYMKELILKKTNAWTKAKVWLKSLGFKHERLDHVEVEE